MAFDPKSYKPTKQKVLPVLLLLDISASMSRDNKIDSLYDATVSMIKSFDEQKIKEVQIQLSIITFGRSIDLHTKFTPVEKLNEITIERFVASGMTPLGTALRMAKDMLEDKDILPRPRYKPAVVLVSDGHPTDEWRDPLDKFINDGTTSKCQRFSVGIGSDYNFNMLKAFAGFDENIFQADNSEEIAEHFKTITDSVSMRSKSINPNTIENNNFVKVEKESIKSTSVKVENSYEEDDEWM